MYSIHSPAKLNLFLEVVNKRPDGYHNIDSIFAAVDLCDEITVELLTCDSINVTTDHPSVPNGENNIIYKAVNELKKAFKISSGVSVCVKKRIPVGGGMGGGSSNAASVIATLCNCWNIDVTKAPVPGIAARLGADVPFFLYGDGLAQCTGIGDQIKKIFSSFEMSFVIVNPCVIINTGEIYRSINLTYAPNTSKIFIEMFNTSDLLKISKYFFNRMEETVFARYPQVKNVKDELMNAGCTGSLMSGSGSSVFGLVRNQAQAHTIAEVMRENHPEWQVFTARHIPYQYATATKDDGSSSKAT